MDVHDFTKMFWDYSKKINDHIQFAFQPIFDQYGITLLQARILIEIYGHGKHTIGSLANSINMAGTNISTMCKKLENLELLSRVRDSQDERIVNVVLTLKGQQIVESFNREVLEKVSKYMKMEPQQNLQDILKGLQELEKLLQHIAKTE
jgi:MarR family transcriptional regulator, organic hydroperoxide resistance regulator